MIGGIETLTIQAVEQKGMLSEQKIPNGKEFLPNHDLPGTIEGDGRDIPIMERSDGPVIERPDIAFIERTTRLSLIEQNAAAIEKSGNNNEGTAESDSGEKKGLTDEEKDKIKEETGWSDEIIDCIQNMKQYEILKNAGLKEVEINGRKCLIKENIDLDYADADGVTNRERMARGLAPLDSKSGKPIELHHLGQKKDSPLVELTEEEHRTGDFEDGKKNQSLWHNNNKDTEVHGEGNTWDTDRKEYWKARLLQEVLPKGGGELSVNAGDTSKDVSFGNSGERANLERDLSSAKHKLESSGAALETLSRNKADGMVGVDSSIGYRKNEIADAASQIRDLEYKLSRLKD